MDVSFYLAWCAKVNLRVGDNLKELFPVAGNVPIDPDDIYPACEKVNACQKIGDKIKSYVVDQDTIDSREPQVQLQLNSLENRISFQLKGSLFEYASTFLEEISIKAELTGFACEKLHDNKINLQRGASLNTMNMKARRDPGTNKLVFEDSWENTLELQQQKVLVSCLEPDEVHCCLATLICSGKIIDASSPKAILLPDIVPRLDALEELAEFTTKIRHNVDEADTVIVASNGAEVKCHKLFLMSSSPVFQSMLTDKSFTEAENSRIEITDMSEFGVKALLAYLYYMDTRTPQDDLDICLELLEASEKYSIARMKTNMTKILLAKNESSFSAAQALQVYMFARNVQDLTALKDKSLEVLKKKQFGVDEEYKAIMKKNPQAAVELYEALMQ